MGFGPKVLLRGGAAAIALLAASAAYAQVKSFDVPSEDAVKAIPEFARQAGIQILVPANELKGVRTPAIKGNLDTHEALRALLAGTGCTIASDDGQTIALEAPSKNAVAASAEPEAAAPGNSRVEIVVVTAEKRAESLQEVPLSVTAVTGEEIAKRGITNLEQMQYSIPGLSAFEYGPGAEFIQINGIADAYGAPTVGRYLDEMPVGGSLYAEAPDLRLLDMQRVEVLRGPQATLYGEGSMGGTIRYLTNNPDLDNFSASLQSEVGGVDDGGTNYRGVAIVNIPIVEGEMGLRLVGGYEYDGGWIDDSVTGQKNINHEEISTLRAKFLTDIGSDGQFSVLYLHQHSDAANQNFATNGISTAVLPQPFNEDYDLVNSIFTYDLGDVNLLESFGYLNEDINEQYDVTPFYSPVLTLLGIPPGYITKIGLPAVSDARTLTEELRLSSQNNERFNWTVGGYYLSIDTSGVSAISTSPGTLPFSILSSTATTGSRAWALFGQATYEILPNLTALAGLRYYENTANIHSESVSLGFPALDVGSATFHSVDPRFNLKYEFSPDSMVYLNASKGFRSGGFNLTSEGAGIYKIPPTYAPDSLWNYEVGTKQIFLDGKASFDGAVYYTDWSGVQSAEYAPGSAVEVIVNGPKVSGWGVDLSGEYLPLDGLTLTATYSWNDLSYGPLTPAQMAGAAHYEGDPVDYARHNSGSASLDYRHPVFGDAQGYFRIDYQHAGHAQITARNFASLITPLAPQDLVNMRMGIDIDRYEIGIFATNLADNRTPTFKGPLGVILQNLEQQPRVIGVDLNVRF